MKKESKWKFEYRQTVHSMKALVKSVIKSVANNESGING